MFPAVARGAGPLQLRCGTDTQPSQVVTQSVAAMLENIERESGGAVKIALYPSSSLGSAGSMAQQLRDGALDFALVATDNLSGLEPLFAVGNVGFAFVDNATGYRAMDGPLGNLVRKRLLDLGIYAFDRVMGAGFTQVMNGVRPVGSPSDLAGLKLRTPTSRVIINMLQTLGGVPAPIDLAQVYTSLQTHLVDGIIITLDGFEGAHLYEVQKYVSLLNPAWASRSFLASGSVWHGIPADVQAVIDRNVMKFVADERIRIDASEGGYVAKLRQQGLAVIRPDIAPFRAKCGPHYAWCRQTFGDTAWSLLEQTTGNL